MRRNNLLMGCLDAKKPEGRNRRGFTLLEMCMVLFIGGVALVAGIDMLQQYRAQQALKINEERISTIKKALAGYIGKNNRLPCAAPRNVGPADVNYGRGVDCAVAAVAPATVSVPGINQTTNAVDLLRPVRIGAVPVRDLGLSSAYIGDTWGNQFIYAVTEALTAAPFNPSLAAINIIKDPATPLVSELTPPGSAFYTVIGPGKNGKGAWSIDGRLKSACPIAPLAHEDWNCNETLMAVSGARFVAAPFSTSQNAQFFDDQVIYSNVANPIDLPVCGPSQVLTSDAAGENFICKDLPFVPPDCAAGERLTSNGGGVFTCQATPFMPPACPAGQYLARAPDGLNFTCVAPDPPPPPPPPPTVPSCGTSAVLSGNGTGFICQSLAIKTVEVTCTPQEYPPSWWNDWQCEATCPAGTSVTGGGFIAPNVDTFKGRNAYMRATGYFCSINFEGHNCKDGSSAYINGCGYRCSATCAYIQ
jgi:prepilin-type N-terminal cleavage/methylation domain-containing protein